MGYNLAWDQAKDNYLPNYEQEGSDEKINMHKKITTLSLLYKVYCSVEKTAKSGPLYKTSMIKK